MRKDTDRQNPGWFDRVRKDLPAWVYTRVRKQDPEWDFRDINDPVWYTRMGKHDDEGITKIVPYTGSML